MALQCVQLHSRCPRTRNSNETSFQRGNRGPDCIAGSSRAAVVTAAASPDVASGNASSPPSAAAEPGELDSRASRHSSWLHSRHDKEIWRLALPAALALAADPLLGMVDTALVGRLGADELAALGINTSLFSLSFVVFNFLATATTPAVAASVAANNTRAAGETVWQATSLAVLLGVAVTAGMFCNGRWMLAVMGADQSQQHMQDLALQYLRFRAFAAPAVLLTTVGQGVFRGISNMRAPLLITLATNAVHLVLDLLLMFPCGLGIKGAAISTAVSEWLAAAAYTSLVWHRREQLGLWPLPRMQLSELKERYFPFVQAGSAVFMRTGSLLGTKTLATAVAAHMGPSSVATHQVLMQLWVLASMLVDSLAVSGQTLIAVNLGQGQQRQAREIAERLLQLGVGCGVVLSAAMLAGSPWWPQLFTEDDGVLGQIHALVPLAVLPLPVNALVYTLDGVLVGASDFGYLMTAMVGASAVAASMLTMVEPSGSGLTGVWASLAVLMIGRLATLGWRFQSPSGPLPPSFKVSMCDTLPEQPEQRGQADVQSLQQQQLLLLQGLQEQQQQHQEAPAVTADSSGSSGNSTDDSYLGVRAAVPIQQSMVLSNSVPSSKQLRSHRRVARQHKQLSMAEPATCTTTSKPYRKVHNGCIGAGKHTSTGRVQQR